MKRRPSVTSAFIPLMPAWSDLQTVTQRLLVAAPGHFDAVAMFAINIATVEAVVDGAALAVTERSDTDRSKTIPSVGGQEYNALAAVGTQKGWLPVTWNGQGSITLPAGSLMRPAVALSDFIALSSIDRLDKPGGFPLVMASAYYNNRSTSMFTFSSIDESHKFSTLLSPYEWYQTAQWGVDGVSQPAQMTATWSAAGGSKDVRIFGLAFRTRGSADLILFTGDSIIKGLGAGGDTTTNNAMNSAGAWVTRSALGLANVNRPVGFVNAGIGSQPSATYLQRAKDLMALLHPTISVYPVYTPNDSPVSDAVNSAEFARALDFADTCYNGSTVPVLVAPVPYSGAGTEGRRQGVVNKVRALRGIASIDPNVAGVFDPTNAAGSYWAPGATVDGTHPADQAYAAIANLAALPVLSSLLGSRD
jgi:lysophospholipase L1-like esterase